MRAPCINKQKNFKHMNKKLALLLIFNISIFCAFSQRVESIKTIYDDLNDGPYVFITNNHLEQRDIINGKMVINNLEGLVYDTIYNPQKSIFNNVGKIAILSDLHGQLQLTLNMLKNNKVIDQNSNWSFENGHLVIVGDVFDRGDKVNELLWLIYKLESQAKKMGGNVHFLMGNHEYMVLFKDLRYIHEKYQKVSNILNISYEELYSDKTVLGRWLQSKPSIVKINDIIFVHAGISKEFLKAVKFDLEAINNTMRQAMRKSKEELKSSGTYATYFGSSGLIWYRGYFNEGFDKAELSEILKETKSEHIVVGHTSQTQIISLFNHKLFGVDSSIKQGVNGELLIVENNQFYRATKEGERIKL